MESIEKIKTDLEQSMKDTFFRLEAWREDFIKSVPVNMRQDEYGRLAVSVYDNIIEGNVDRAIALLYKFKEPAERIAKVEMAFAGVWGFIRHHNKLACRRLERRDGLPKGSLDDPSRSAAEADAIKLRMYEKEFGKVEAAKILKIKPTKKADEAPKQKRNNRITKGNRYRS